MPRAEKMNFHITFREGGCVDVPVDPVPETFNWHFDTDNDCLVLRYSKERREYYPLRNVFKVTFTMEPGEEPF